jgi:Chlorophyll A-B binding protein
MKFTTVSVLTLVFSAEAFSPFGGGPKPASKSSSSKAATFVEETVKQQKKIYDPLGLYSNSSPERVAGIIQPLETPLEKDDTIVDPLSLYQVKSEVSDNADRSLSLPFLKRPAMLDGSLPGDRGFDPFNFSSDASALQWYRDSEVRHARIAMLAAVGWPLAELFHKNIASDFGLESALTEAGKVPSILNGGLTLTSPLFWVAAISVTAALEFWSTKNQNSTGNYGFDPLGLGGKTDKQKFFMSEAEIFNGRLAMLAITGFALQEFFTNTAVINQTPIFFKPFADVVSQLLESGAAGTSV